MPTTKPQFNVYLDPEIHKQIDAHTTLIGAKKGKLVEAMWRFYNLRDLASLHDKLAAKIARGLTDHERSELGKMHSLIKQTFDTPQP